MYLVSVLEFFLWEHCFYYFRNKICFIYYNEKYFIPVDSHILNMGVVPISVGLIVVPYQ